MSITSYPELLTAVQNWAWRDDDDFSARCAEFIALAESDLSKKLRVLEMRKTVTLPIAGGVFPLPSDLTGIINLRTLNNPRVSLEPIGDVYADYANGSRGAGLPSYYSIDADGLHVYPANAGDLMLTYWQAIPPLSQANPTNWLLQKSPNLYLYASLVQAIPYIGDDGRQMSFYGQMMQDAIDSLMTVNTLTQYAGARMRVAGPTP